MAASPSGPPSTSSSQGSFEEPKLDGLVEYLLASKRSLSSISLVWRAREIVDSGREALEENAALSAKNTFIRQGVDGQIEALEAIKYGTSLVDAEGYAEFQATVQSLDKASTRLDRTLETLRTTVVEPSFRPATDPPKYLFDFVDEVSIGELENSIKASIDRFEVARTTLVETCEGFEQDLQRLHESLRVPTEIGEGGDELIPEMNISPVPSLFYALETQATETATHLEGLVRHYDLCVTALKHTDGGGEAISQASDGEQDQQALVGLGVDLGKLEETPPQPMGEDERKNMLAVLVKDAGEVDDVVLEIKDSLAEMENQLLEIMGYVQMLRDTSTRLRNALDLLKQVAGNVPSYMTACSEFQASWEAEKGVLSEKMEELEGLRHFYSGFSNAYDGLLIEAQRRKHVKRDMEKVLMAAMNELERLHQADFEERENFRAEHGEFIPSDLWRGLVNGPARYQVVQAEEDADELPDIKKSVLDKALHRVREREKPFKK